MAQQRQKKIYNSIHSTRLTPLKKNGAKSSHVSSPLSLRDKIIDAHDSLVTILASSLGRKVGYHKWAAATSDRGAHERVKLLLSLNIYPDGKHWNYLYH